MKTQAIAIQIAEGINISACKTICKEHKLLFSDSDELFFALKNKKYLYIFKYGVLCVYNFTSIEIENLKKEIKEVGLNYKPTHDILSESIEITTEADVFVIDFNSINLTDSNPESLRLIMLNLSQSIALDNYATITGKILEDTRAHTNYLEEKGKLDITGRNLKKYIGKVLNVKNKISENLYIFDSPDAVWDNEGLNKLNNALKRNFDLKDRYQVISQQVNIVKENLELFKDIMDHKESSRLEWIIIILIVIEVIDMLILKL